MSLKSYKSSTSPSCIIKVTCTSDRSKSWCPCVIALPATCVNAVYSAKRTLLGKSRPPKLTPVFINLPKVIDIDPPGGAVFSRA